MSPSDAEHQTRRPDRRRLTEWIAIGVAVVSVLASSALSTLAVTEASEAIELQRQANKVQQDADARERDRVRRGYAARVTIWYEFEPKLDRRTKRLPVSQHIDNRATGALFAVQIYGVATCTGPRQPKVCHGQGVGAAPGPKPCQPTGEESCRFTISMLIMTFPPCTRLTIPAEEEFTVQAISFTDVHGVMWVRVGGVLTELTAQDSAARDRQRWDTIAAQTNYRGEPHLDATIYQSDPTTLSFHSFSTTPIDPCEVPQ